MYIAFLAKLCAKLIDIYQWIIIIRLFMSWLPNLQYSNNRLVIWIFSITDPVLHKFQEWFSFLRIGFFDFSPIILILFLQLLESLFIRTSLRYMM